MHRVLVVADKWWEADPLVAVLSSAGACPPSVRFVPGSGEAGFRGYIEGSRGRVEVWCLQERMSAQVSASSSQEKANVLPGLLAATDIIAVISFATAATPGPNSQNGCVVVGTNAWIHDPKVAKTDSHWPCPVADQLLTSSLGTVFTTITTAPGYVTTVEGLMIPPPNKAASKLDLDINPDYVAVTEINVTNPADYTTADQAVITSFNASGVTEPLGSLETTHGVIRACMPDAKNPARFMFVSGITDRVGKYGCDIQTALYQQNFVAAHNAGVAIAQMVPALLTLLGAR